MSLNDTAGIWFLARGERSACDMSPEVGGENPRSVVLEDHNTLDAGCGGLGVSKR